MFDRRVFYFTYNEGGQQKTMIIKARLQTTAVSEFLKSFPGGKAPKGWIVKEVRA